jgi:hypothetical protein
MTKFQDKVGSILSEANKENKNITRLVRILRKNGYEIIPGKEKDIVEYINPSDIDPKELENFVMDQLTNSKEDIEPFVRKIGEGKKTETTPKTLVEKKPAEVNKENTPTTEKDMKTNSADLSEDEISELISVISDKDKNDFSQMLNLIKNHPEQDAYKSKINSFIENNKETFTTFSKALSPTNDNNLKLMTIFYYISERSKGAFDPIKIFLKPDNRLFFNEIKNPKSAKGDIIQGSINAKLPHKLNPEALGYIIKGVVEDEKKEPLPQTNETKTPEKETPTTTPTTETGDKTTPTETTQPTSDDSTANISKAKTIGEFEDASLKAAEDVHTRYQKLKTDITTAQKKAEDASITPSQKTKITKTANDVNKLIIEINKDAQNFSEIGITNKLEGNNAVFQVNKNILKLTDDDFKDRTNVARKTIRETIARFRNINLKLDSAENQAKMFGSIQTIGSSFKGTVDTIKGSPVWKNLQSSIPARALAGLTSVATNAIDRQTFYSYVDRLGKFKNVNWGENDQFKNKLYNIGINSFKIDDKKKRQEIQKKVFDIFDAMGNAIKNSEYEGVKDKLNKTPEGQAKLARVDKLKGFNLTVG